MRKIFVVEDDDSIRDMLLYALSSVGFDVEGFSDAEAFYAALVGESPCLLLLDIMLPGEDGLSILRSLREGSPQKPIPVIMLSAKGSEFDRVMGLDLGADDYITKPFSVMEVISRVKAVLRRSEASAQPENSGEIEVGGISLYYDRRVALASGEELCLTYKEFELLNYMMINEGLVLSREKLLDQVWGYDYEGESRTVDMHIKTLRRKLGEKGGMIKTIRNIGYKLDA